MWNKLSKAYINHAPAHVKQAASLQDQHAFLNPTGNALADYGIYGGAGALGGAGIGALINLLRDEDVLTGALMGGGAGLGLGLGGKALADMNMNPRMAAFKQLLSDQNQLVDRHNAFTGALGQSKGLEAQRAMQGDPNYMAPLPEARDAQMNEAARMLAAIEANKVKLDEANKGMSALDFLGIG